MKLQVTNTLVRPQDVAPRIYFLQIYRLQTTHKIKAFEVYRKPVSTELTFLHKSTHIYDDDEKIEVGHALSTKQTERQLQLQQINFCLLCLIATIAILT